MNPRWLMLVSGLLLLCCAGCGGNDAQPTASSVTGTWSGAAVGGSRMAVTFEEGGVLSAVTQDGTVSGAYTLDGNALSGTVGDKSFVGAVSGDVINLLVEGGGTATLSRQTPVEG